MPSIQQSTQSLPLSFPLWRTDLRLRLRGACSTCSGADLKQRSLAGVAMLPRLRKGQGRVTWTSTVATAAVATAAAITVYKNAYFAM